MPRQYKSPAHLLTVIKNFTVGVFVVLSSSFICGGVYLYVDHFSFKAEVKEQLKDMPSVTGLIVTQQDLNGKVPQCSYDSYHKNKRVD